MESNVEDITPPTTDVKPRELVMAIVGQDLREGRKHALRHGGASGPCCRCTDVKTFERMTKCASAAPAGSEKPSGAPSPTSRISCVCFHSSY